MEVKCFDSKDKNVSKYVFDFKDAVAEAVLYKYPTYKERTVICCSTQSGCPVGCNFCGTGKRFVRNLTFKEILNQVLSVLDNKGIKGEEVERFQIMFMSMGEPMLNFRNVKIAIVMLHHFYPNAELLISTSAPRRDYSGLFELSREIEQVGLQFSIHENTDEARDKLIPFKKKLTLMEIRALGEKWYGETGRKPYFNYCVHEGNNKVEDVERLKDLFLTYVWEATLSVICEKDETIAQSHKRQEKMTMDFMELMNKAGFSTRMFNPAGQDDIGGGCGQLWHTQKWMKENIKVKGGN